MLRSGGGCVGILLTGLFAHGELGEGLVYGNARLLWVQMVGCVAIGAWSCTLSMVFWVVMRWLGLTRMSEEAELLGTDQQLFCEPAYPESYAMGDYLKVCAGPEPWCTNGIVTRHGGPHAVQAVCGGAVADERE